MLFKSLTIICIFLISAQYFSSTVLGKTYFFPSNETANFFKAFILCKQLGLELASMESVQESINFDYAVFNLSKYGGANGFWIAGTMLYNTSELNFYWLNNGRKFTHENWLLGKPTNKTGDYCVEWTSDSILGKGWNNYNCSAELRYACQSIENNTMRIPH